MTERFVEQVVNKVSLAVRLVDGYTAEAPLGRVNVWIKDPETRPLKNTGGYYVFMDLPAGGYKLVVESDYYIAEETDIQPGDFTYPKPSVKTVVLRPHSAYPFQAGATLFRGVVRGPKEQPVEGASVSAIVVQPEKALRAKTGQGGAKKGDTALALENIASPISEGSVLVIRDTVETRIEFCKIKGPVPADPKTQPFTLEEPLRFDHSPGTPVHPAFAAGLTTRTTGKGELVLYVTPVKANLILTRIEVTHPDYKPVRVYGTAGEGNSASLGVIKIPDSA